MSLSLAANSTGSRAEARLTGTRLKRAPAGPRPHFEQAPS